MSNRRVKVASFFLAFFLVAYLISGSADAQQVLGAITGTVKDASGASAPDATVKARNVSTNLSVTVHTQQNGFYSIPNLPIGTYELSFTKSGFETETHPQVPVQGDRTTTVDGTLKVGATSTTVEVVGTPLMNQVDTTNGYVVDQLTIQQTPLGTGSFTQLAILSPGVNADFLGGSGSNAGLGNQAIFANGQRDTSNSFSLNGISTNNLFNGNSSSQVGENRFVLNTGENFGAGGEIQTSTSVYGAIGQALPTPAPESIQEISVNTAMYDASQGSNSGAHIGVITKSGTNQVHGQVYEKFQNSAMNAAPYFYNAAGLKVPFVNRNTFGATFGGPIKKDKLFYFVAYQGVRIADAQDATRQVTVPQSLTDDRSPAALVQVANIQIAERGSGTPISVSQISPVSLGIMQAKLPNGSYLIPSPTITNPATAFNLGYNTFLQGPNAQAIVDQGNANIDYVLSDKDRLAVKYYIQNDPTTNPFGATGDALGFPQQLEAGSQVGSIDNTIVLTPALNWQQRIGFTADEGLCYYRPGFFARSVWHESPRLDSFPQNRDQYFGRGSRKRL
jgi:hypothetical protein